MRSPGASVAWSRYCRTKLAVPSFGADPEAAVGALAGTAGVRFEIGDTPAAQQAGQLGPVAGPLLAPRSGEGLFALPLPQSPVGRGSGGGRTTGHLGRGQQTPCGLGLAFAHGPASRLGAQALGLAQ